MSSKDAQQAQTDFIKQVDPEQSGKYDAGVGGQDALKASAGARELDAAAPVEKFGQPIVLMEGPASINWATPASTALFAGGQLQWTTQADLHMAAAHTVASVAANATGLFTHDGGASNKAAIAKNYKREDPFPNLLAYKDADGVHPDIAAFSGKMTNRALQNGEQIFRFFGTKRATHGVTVDETFASSAWWGLGRPPRTAKEWRELAAVLDGFNGDGYFVTARVIEKKGPNAVVGTVSEQVGKKIPGQYLPGGATQAVIHFDDAIKNILKEAGQQMIAGKKLTRLLMLITDSSSHSTSPSGPMPMAYGDMRPRPAEQLCKLRGLVAANRHPKKIVR